MADGQGGSRDAGTGRRHQRPLYARPGPRLPDPRPGRWRPCLGHGRSPAARCDRRDRGRQYRLRSRRGRGCDGRTGRPPAVRRRQHLRERAGDPAGRRDRPADPRRPRLRPLHVGRLGGRRGGPQDGPPLSRRPRRAQALHLHLALDRLPRRDVVGLDRRGIETPAPRLRTTPGRDAPHPGPVLLSVSVARCASRLRPGRRR